MSNKFDRMKKTANNCDDLNIKMKTDGKLICGCGGDNEFEYDPNLFDCRLFGIFLRKAENSHKKYQGILSKLNLLETAIFENKETGDSSVIKEKVNNIIDTYADVNLNNDTRDFITKYMTDKSKRKEDYNRYQLMSTLQSALNYIEVARNPQMSQLLTIISNWVSKSDKVLKGVSVSQQEVNQDLVLNPTAADIQIQNINNQQASNTRNVERMVMEQIKPEQPYKETEQDTQEQHKKNIQTIMNIANVLSSSISKSYFEPLLNKLSEYKTKVETIKDKVIYTKHFHTILYTGENQRNLFDIFRKLNEKLNEIKPTRTSEESKHIFKSLKQIFQNYNDSIGTYSHTNLTKRKSFISSLYMYILLSDKLKDHEDFKSLTDRNNINNTKARSIITDNLKKLLHSQKEEYITHSESFKNETSTKEGLQNIKKNIKETGNLNDNSSLLTELINGKDGKEKYIKFDYNPPNSSSSSFASS